MCSSTILGVTSCHERVKLPGGVGEGFGVDRRGLTVVQTFSDFYAGKQLVGSRLRSIDEQQLASNSITVREKNNATETTSTNAKRRRGLGLAFRPYNLL